MNQVTAADKTTGAKADIVISNHKVRRAIGAGGGEGGRAMQPSYSYMGDSNPIRHHIAIWVIALRVVSNRRMRLRSCAAALRTSPG